MATTPLEKVLPLKMPISILIDPSNKCNFKCSFCPTGDKDLLKSVGREEKIMDIDSINKILEDLIIWRNKTGTIPKQIGFYKDGEPLLNKNLFYFISTISKNNLTEKSFLTTNAALLNESKCIELINSGLNEIRISVEHVHDKGYQEITRTKTPYYRVKENVEMLFKLKNKFNSKLHIHSKVVADLLTEDERSKFKEDFLPISDSIALDRIMGWSDSNNHDFSTGKIDHNSKKTRHQICAQPFSRMSICANGDITICCVDWSHQLKYGNIKDVSLMDAWNSGRLNKIRLTHLRGDFSNESVCKNCDYFKNQSSDDNIDSIKEKLLDYCNSKDSNKSLFN
jgi:radical SAM protein with 4Fe4S-binding SPASM domain